MEAMKNPAFAVSGMNTLGLLAFAVYFHTKNSRLEKIVAELSGKLETLTATSVVETQRLNSELEESNKMVDNLTKRIKKFLKMSKPPKKGKKHEDKASDESDESEEEEKAISAIRRERGKQKT